MRPSTAEVNTALGVVESNEYLGAGYEAQVRTADGMVAFIRTDHSVRVGDQVPLFIHPDKLMVYPTGVGEDIQAEPAENWSGDPDSVNAQVPSRG